MASRLLLATAAIALLVGLLISFIMRHLIPRASQIEHSKKERKNAFPGPTKISKSLAEALPESIITPHSHDDASFRHSMKSYWALQETEVPPACFVRPRNVEELSTAVKILKSEYDKQSSTNGTGLFAVRGGGHSPVPSAASIKGGALIDLSLLNKVIISDDGASVTIGAGAKWMDVSKLLDEKGLAVAGGRNSAVGVGGLTLGGKLFFEDRRSCS